MMGAWAVGRALAVDAVWTNTHDRVAQWTNAVHWTDGAGAARAVAPTNGEDVALADLAALPPHDAFVPDSALTGHQRLMTGATHDDAALAAGGGAVNPVLGAVTGDGRHTIQVDAWTARGSYVRSAYLPANPTEGVRGRYVDVADPNGFLGFWEPYGVLSRLVLHPTAERTPVLHNVLSRQRPAVCVPGEGLRAEIGSLYGGGALDKTGAGVLALRSVSGEATRVYAHEGSLEIGGEGASELGDLLSAAALHLDASDASTLVCEPDAEGLAVVRWDDVRRNGVYAGPDGYTSADAHFLPYCTNPVLRAGAAPTGLPLVDFGSKNGAEGRRWCVQKICPGRISGVRAVFYAADCPSDASGAMILGDIGSLQFMCGERATELYNGTYSDPAVRYADLTLNLRKVGFRHEEDRPVTAAELTALHVVAQDTLRPTRVGLLGSREHYRNATGGIRLGEVILFTNALTRAQRMRIARHLDAKWRTGARAPDVAAVVADGVAEVSVPDGQSATVDFVCAPSGLVKRGGGTLAVRALEPAALPIAVEGGAVALRAPSVDATAGGVASNAWLWLDAERAETDGGADGAKLVRTWKDCRAGVSEAAVSAHADEPHVPRLVRSPLCGRAVVDFGGWNRSATAWDAGSDAAWMKLSNHVSSEHLAYHSFCVMRIKGESLKPGGSAVEYGMPLIWSTDMECYRDDHKVVSPNYRSVRALSAHWNVNGVPIDPLTYTGLAFAPEATNRFFLLSLSSAQPIRLNQICKDRDESAAFRHLCGGMEVGEMIVYDRMLTADERRGTEAYLMRKWLGRRHPAETAAPSLSFGEAAASILDIEADLTVPSLSGGTGEVVKRGAGDVTVGKVAAGTSVRSVSVEAGGLTLTLPSATFLDEATHRFDALDARGFADVETVDGVTNVNAWTDSVAGLRATAETDGLSNVRPQRVTVETRTGVRRPVVDFGEVSWSTNAVVVQRDSASMLFASPIADVKEAVAVVADRDAARPYQSIFGGRDGNVSFNRGLDGRLYYADDAHADFKASSLVRNAHTYCNGARTEGANFRVPSGFNVFDWTMTNDETGESTPWPDNHEEIGGFARLGCALAGGQTAVARRGGLYVAEFLTFRRILKKAERDALSAYLKWKWLGEARPAPQATNRLERISVAAGSTLTLGGDAALSAIDVSSLAGAGTVSVPAMSFAGALDVTLANGQADVLTVDGALTQAGPVTVNVTVDPSGGRLSPGDYPILAARELVGFDAARWTVRVRTAPRGLVFDRVALRAGVVCLRVSRSGFLFVVR